MKGEEMAMTRRHSLEGKFALVVGASSGMGEATARAFADAGARVALSARSAGNIQRIAEEIGPAAVPVPADVEKADEVDRLVRTVLERFGRIDVLAFTAGTNVPKRSLKELTLENWDLLLRTNLTGAFLCTRAVLPAMREQRDGLIIYVSSVSAIAADVSGVAYQAAKRGLVGLAHATFREERDNGVRTTVIYPGLTDTPIMLKRPVPTPAETLARALRPQDVAEACLFVACLPARAYVPELTIAPSALS